MSRNLSGLRVCSVCGGNFQERSVIPAAAVSDNVAKEILQDHQTWLPEGFVCRGDLNKYRSRYVHSLLLSEKGDVTALEEEIVNCLRDHDILSKHVEATFDQQWSFGERLADKIATFGGSWTFLVCFGVFLVIWVLVNSVILLVRPFDPFPFILLNLILSCLAAIQAPVIMMSQNRQEAKDRLRSQHDYQVNLKAELEIRHLHDKIDHLLSHQWERLAQIQEVQLDVLSELTRQSE
jgi:Predicted membrane protein